MNEIEKMRELAFQNLKSLYIKDTEAYIKTLKQITLNKYLEFENFIKITDLRNSSVNRGVDLASFILTEQSKDVSKTIDSITSDKPKNPNNDVFLL